MATPKLLPDNWNPKSAAGHVLAGLRNVCLPAVKGTHDKERIMFGKLEV